LNRASASSADLAEARQWTAVAAGRDSKNPEIWTLLASADAEVKAYGLAHSEYYRALSCDKWYIQALQGLAELAGTEHNWRSAVHFYRLALTAAVDDAVMSASLRGALKSAEQRAARRG